MSEEERNELAEKIGDALRDNAHRSGIVKTWAEYGKVAVDVVVAHLAAQKD